MHAEHRVEEPSGPHSGVRFRLQPVVGSSPVSYGDDEPTLSAIPIPFVVITRSRLALIGASCFVAGAFLSTVLGWIQ